MAAKKSVAAVPPVVPSAKAAEKAPAVRKGQVWVKDERRLKVTGFEQRAGRLAKLEPINGVGRKTRMSVARLQKEWKLDA